MNSEEFSAQYLIKKIGLDITCFENYEEVVRLKNKSQYIALQTVPENFHTPDYVISDKFDDLLENLLFVDVSGPKGGLLTKAGIEIDKDIAKKNKNLSIGTTMSVELTKQVRPLLQGVRSKLNKINKKYALNRDLKGSISSQTGIIYCMEDIPVKVHHLITNHDLGEYQLSITTLELLDLLSDGRCQYSDIERVGLNRPVIFDFNKNYENIAFVIFIGQASLTNQSYIFLNRTFMNKSNNVSVQKFNELSPIDGNSFRKVRCSKSKIVLDINQSIVDESNPYIFPYGNINYKGNVFPNTDIPLIEVDLEEINKQFDNGLK